MDDLKACTAIFLFTCLTVPFLGSYVWLEGRMGMAKKAASLQIRKAIPQEEQFLWKISIADATTQLFWEHSREFEYKGEMYDVIRLEQKGDTMWYWCYWDRKETKLKRQLNLLAMNMLGPAPENRNHGQQINDFFRSLFYPVFPHHSTLAFPVPHSRCISPYRLSISLHDATPPSPPPRLS